MVLLVPMVRLVAVQINVRFPGIFLLGVGVIKRFANFVQFQCCCGKPLASIWLIQVLLASIKYIRSILEDSPMLSFVFRFSLLMLCICCKVRDRHTSRSVIIKKHKKQQRSCIFVKTRTQQKKRKAGSRRKMSQVLFTIFTGKK